MTWSVLRYHAHTCKNPPHYLIHKEYDESKTAEDETDEGNKATMYGTQLEDSTAGVRFDGHGR